MGVNSIGLVNLRRRLVGSEFTKPTIENRNP